MEQLELYEEPGSRRQGDGPLECYEKLESRQQDDREEHVYASMIETAPPKTENIKLPIKAEAAQQRHCRCSKGCWVAAALVVSVLLNITLTTLFAVEKKKGTGSYQTGMIKHLEEQAVKHKDDIFSMNKTMNQQKQTIDDQTGMIRRLEEQVVKHKHERINQVQVPVRIVGGNQTAGRVQVFHMGTWRSICDNGWDDNDAKVVCRMLDFSGGTALQGSYSQFGYAYYKGAFWLDEMDCYGNETDIPSCQYTGWGIDRSRCDGNNAAKIICNETVHTPVRLVGANSTAGRVEVQHQGEWMPVCDDSWDNMDAMVVCRMLGFSDGNTVRGSSKHFGQPRVGSFWLDNVQCCGGETDIALCRHNGWGINNCWPSETAEVICSMIVFQEPELRSPTWVYLDGGNKTAGRVVIYHSGLWRGVCDSGWDDKDAQVVCHMLGLTGGTALSGYCRGCSWLDSVECVGNETDIALCGHSGWGVECDENSAAKLICHNTVATPVRLVGGNNSAGRVEVQHLGEWRGVCGNNWDSKDAHVVCRMLGYRAGAAVRGSAALFGMSSEDYAWLDDVACDCGSADIALCSYQGWGVKCGQDEAAKVICRNSTDTTPVWLVGGNSTAGRVEVQHGGEWRGICHYGWDDKDARVVCRMLGLSGGTAFKGGYQSFGQPSTANFWLVYLYCAGTEIDITDCCFPGWGTHYCGGASQAAKVVCSGRGN